jgi:hypothetical protein
MGPAEQPQSSTPLLQEGPPRVSLALRIWAVVFGVIVGAYVSQKLQGPLGLDGDDHKLLFWAFFIWVMAGLAVAFVGGVLFARRLRGR